MGGVYLPFFGRQAELEALRLRCAEPGLTIVKGPPKIGKTRLLREFVDETRAAGTNRIGWAESGEASGDVLLRAIRDVYDDWYECGGFAAEIKTVLEQMEGKWITRAGVAFGKALGKFTGPAEDMVKAGFDALDSARKMAETGGVQLPRLTSEEACDLLTFLAEGQACPVVIVLNQWEDGQDLGKDTATLQTFLAAMADWPDLHVILHLREPRFPEDRNQDARERATALLQFPATGEVEIGLLDFGQDQKAYENLVIWLAEHFAPFAVAGTGDPLEDIALEEIDGHPAVLSEWSHASEADRASIERLHEIAADARALHYPELRRIFGELLDAASADDSRIPRLELALLAATLPLPVEAGEQRAILPAVRGETSESDLIWLESHDLLRPEGGPPLSLGHPSRRETAERIALGRDERHGGGDDPLFKRLKPYLRRAVARVVPAIVELHPPEAWSGLREETEPVARVLRASSGLVEASGAGVLGAVLCAAARSLFPDVESVMPDGVAATAARDAGPSARALVAIGLFNASTGSEPNSARADGLLGELRDLYNAHGEDGAVRQRLAMGLFNAFNNSEPNSARASERLKDLRDLYEAHTEDAGVRENLAMGLFNAFNDSEPNSARADGLLDELRALSKAHTEDTAVRERLAKGLFNAFNRSEQNSARADGLLGELRDLYNAHGEDGAVRQRLAMGLFNAFNNSEPNSARAGERLNDLRALSKAHAEDAAVREDLAKAYGASIQNAVQGGDVVRAAGMAEALAPLADAVRSQPGYVPLFEEVIAAAIDLTVEQGDTESERRLRVARDAIFGAANGDGK